MANAERGEVDLVVGDKAYTLRLTWNEIAEFESMQGVSWFEEFATKLAKPNKVSGGEWRSLLWAGLRQNHPSLTVFDAGDLMTKAGIDLVVEKMGECLRFTFPVPDENPPKAGLAPDGTGK